MGNQCCNDAETDQTDGVLKSDTRVKKIQLNEQHPQQDIAVIKEEPKPDHSAFDRVDESFFELNNVQKQLLKERGLYNFWSSEAELAGTERFKIARSSGPSFKFMGQMSNDKKNGKAHFRYPNGDFAVVTFVNDVAQGTGALYCTNGDYYFGKIANNQKLEGLLRLADGSTYRGSFRDNLYEGQGVFKFADGRVYTGNYAKGLRSGFGEYNWTDGSKYVGEWANNKQHGEGIFVERDGKERKGKFAEGNHVL